MNRMKYDTYTEYEGIYLHDYWPPTLLGSESYRYTVWFNYLDEMNVAVTLHVFF